RRIRKLMNGEIASQLAVAGINYPKLFGVSLVHLRQLSQELKISNELADRLWHLSIRETMILATMVEHRDSISDDQLMEWTEALNNLELAEQIAFNLLGKRANSGVIIEKWMLHAQFYVRYAALMALGWQFRFGGEEAARIVKSGLSTIEALATDHHICRAVVHCLKMAGRFSEDLRPEVRHMAERWIQGNDLHLQRSGKDILFELDAVSG
ncbi:MAG: DNA alkylation repair protein, partial [Bacteroidales bacterium]|nr:DNA alkylation repair protein [Bacteroidales bacterium]